MTITINNQILSTIQSSIESCGPRSFAEILAEVQAVCDGLSGLRAIHATTKYHLYHLISSGSVIEYSDDFGVVYVHPDDTSQLFFPLG